MGWFGEDEEKQDFQLTLDDDPRYPNAPIQPLTSGTVFRTKFFEKPTAGWRNPKIAPHCLFAAKRPDGNWQVGAIGADGVRWGNDPKGYITPSGVTTFEAAMMALSLFEKANLSNKEMVEVAAPEDDKAEHFKDFAARNGIAFDKAGIPHVRQGGQITGDGELAGSAIEKTATALADREQEISQLGWKNNPITAKMAEAIAGIDLDTVEVSNAGVRSLSHLLHELRTGAGAVHDSMNMGGIDELKQAWRGLATGEIGQKSQESLQQLESCLSLYRYVISANLYLRRMAATGGNYSSEIKRLTNDIEIIGRHVGIDNKSIELLHAMVLFSEGPSGPPEPLKKLIKDIEDKLPELEKAAAEAKTLDEEAKRLAYLEGPPLQGSLTKTFNTLTVEQPANYRDVPKIKAVTFGRKR